MCWMVCYIFSVLGGDEDGVVELVLIICWEVFGCRCNVDEGRIEL